MKTPLKQPKKQAIKGKKDSKKKKYKVRNWREYNQALVDRGDIKFWISEEAIRNWEEKRKTGKRGAPWTFSNTAIETVITLQQVFHLPLRQTEGFVKSIFNRMGIKVKTPDFSTISIRAGMLPVSIRVRPIRSESLHVVVDSTGIKVYGEGEWKVRQHGWSKRRTWRKLHIGVDEATGDILLGEVTGNDAADCELLVPLLDQLPKEQVINQISTDGAYDRRICYEGLLERGVSCIAIPPQSNARIWQHGNTRSDPLPRDQNLRLIRKIGRKRWKTESRYHRRSLSETAMFRLKSIFGDQVSARVFARQRTQLLLRLKALNRMTMLGMPDTVLAE
jgi:hypothetical protein